MNHFGFITKDNLRPSTLLSRENNASGKIALIALVAFVALSCIALGMLTIVSSHYGFGSTLPFIANIGWEGGAGLLFLGLTAGICALLYASTLLNTSSTSSTPLTIPRQDSSYPSMPTKEEVNSSLERVDLLLGPNEQEIKIENLKSIFSINDQEIFQIKVGDFESEEKWRAVLSLLSFPAIKYLFEEKIIASSLSNLMLLPKSHLKESTFPWSDFLKVDEIRQAFYLNKLDVFPWHALKNEHLDIIFEENLNFLRGYPLDIFKENAEKYSTRDLRRFLLLFYDKPEFPWEVIFPMYDFISTLCFSEAKTCQLVNFIPWDSAPDNILEEVFTNRGEEDVYKNFKFCSIETFKKIINKLKLKPLLRIPPRALAHRNFPWEEVIQRLQTEDLSGISRENFRLFTLKAPRHLRDAIIEDLIES